MAYAEQLPPGNGAGLFGKIPARADFVRENLSDVVAYALAQWIERGMENLAASGLPFPGVLLRFVFTASDAANAAVGVMGPSRDQVGRKFPVALFHVLPVSAVAQNLSAIPATYERFLAEASALVREIPALGHEEALQRLRALRPPDADETEMGRRLSRRALAEEGAAGFAQRLFGDPTEGRQYYAFNTFQIAALRASASAGQGSPTVLDCPVALDLDLLAWLDLAQRLLGWGDRAPSVVWAAEPEPRLLIALGPAPGQILTYFADPSHSSTKLWPLTTTSVDAIRQAASVFEAAMGSAMDGGTYTSVAELFEALQRHRRQ